MITLGEGWTPLIHSQGFARACGADDLWIKDDGINSTGSFKARGLACCLSMCHELGIAKIALGSAGNAASAAAAYAAAAGIEAHIFMPRDVPQANYIECKSYGAHVTLVDGLISDCGRIVAERQEAAGWFDVNTSRSLPRRRQENDGLRNRRAVPLDPARRHSLSTGGGVGLIGIVESVRRTRTARLDRPAAAQNDRRPGRRLRAHRPRF